MYTRNNIKGCLIFAILEASKNPIDLGNMKQRPENDDLLVTPDDPIMIPEESTSNSLSLEGAANFPSINILGRRFNRAILLIHFNIILYSTCFWIQNGVLPVSLD